MAKRPTTIAPNEARHRSLGPGPALAVLLSLAASACSPSLNPLVIKRDTNFRATAAEGNPFTIISTDDEQGFTPDQLRNFKILRAMAIEDEDFREYLLKLWTTDASTITGLDLATLGLTAASSLTGEALAKALAATATAVTGARTAIDKNFFYGKTIDALLFSMVSARASIRTHIQSCLKLPSSQYDLPTAMYDVVQYREAGRLQTAIATIAVASTGSLASAWPECPPQLVPVVAVAPLPRVPAVVRPPTSVPQPGNVAPTQRQLRSSSGAAQTSDAAQLRAFVNAAGADRTERGNRLARILDIARSDPRFQQTQSAVDVITETGPAADDRRRFVVEHLLQPPPR
jgi:hypothetical protein